MWMAGTSTSPQTVKRSNSSTGAFSSPASSFKFQVESYHTKSRDDVKIGDECPVLHILCPNLPKNNKSNSVDKL